MNTKNKDITVKYISTNLLKPAEYNPRKWDKEAETQLKESIKKYFYHFEGSSWHRTVGQLHHYRE